MLNIGPQELLLILNQMFSMFDRLAALSDQRRELARIMSTLPGVSSATWSRTAKGIPLALESAMLTAARKKLGLTADLEARFNEDLTSALLDGVRRVLEGAQVADVHVVWVPGAFELPVTALHCARAGAADAFEFPFL